MALFHDRTDAGRQLARKLSAFTGQPDLLVLGLPRGGVPVAYQVAKELHAPLDIFIVRKLGLPGHEELAMGAVASGGIRILSDEVLHALNVPMPVIDAVTEREQKEIERRERAYRGDRPRAEPRGKTTLLIDDGLATGSSMRAAVAGLRVQGAARIIVAVPIAPIETCELIEQEVDQIVCAATPEPFFAVGRWYDNFEQTSDDEVRDLLKRAPLPVR